MNRTNFIINKVISSTPLALNPTDGYCTIAIKGVLAPMILTPVSTVSVVWYSGRVVVDLTKVASDFLRGRSRSNSVQELKQHFEELMIGSKILFFSSSALLFQAVAVSVLVMDLPIFVMAVVSSVYGIGSCVAGVAGLIMSTNYLDGASIPSPGSDSRSSPVAASRPAPTGLVTPVVMLFNTIRVVYDKLQSNPEMILKLLSEGSFYSHSSHLINIRYLDLNGREQAGVDHGGLTRDFFTRFFKNFTQMAAQNEGFSIEDQGSILLTKRSATTREFEVLGKLLGFARLNDVKIGNVFSVSFYNMIRVFDTTVFEKPFYSLTNEELIALYIERTKLDSNIGKLVEYSRKSLAELKREGKFKTEMLYYAYPDGDFPDTFSDLERVEANFEDFQKVLKQNLLSNARNDPTLEAAFYIGRGLARTAVANWNWIRSEEGYRLSNKIQGVLSREDLLSKVYCPIPSISLNVQRWIREADIKILEDFVFAATGARALGTSDQICVNRSLSASIPFVFHTCGKTVDVREGLSYAEFKEGMENSIHWALAQGFLIS